MIMNWIMISLFLFDICLHFLFTLRGDNLFLYEFWWPSTDENPWPKTSKWSTIHCVLTSGSPQVCSFLITSERNTCHFRSLKLFIYAHPKRFVHSERYVLKYQILRKRMNTCLYCNITYSTKELMLLCNLFTNQSLLLLREENR